MRQEPFLALTDISWVTNHFSDITDKHTFCFCLRLLCKDIWSSNLIYNIYTECPKKGDLGLNAHNPLQMDLR